MKSAPITAVKEQFGSKDKLIAAVEKLAAGDLWIDRVNGEKGLSSVSNAKLLRLHASLSALKKDFGSREKLIDAILALENRAKDNGLKARLERYPAPRLLDMHRAASKRRKARDARAERASSTAAKKSRPARSKKAKAKAKAA